MHMKLHPLVRTSQDIRRSIARLRSFLDSPLLIPTEEAKAADELLNVLEDAHSKIPDQYRDADLAKE